MVLGVRGGSPSGIISRKPLLFLAGDGCQGSLKTLPAGMKGRKWLCSAWSSAPVCFWKEHGDQVCNFGDTPPPSHTHTHTHTHTLSLSLSLSLTSLTTFQLGPLDGTSGFDAAKILAFSPHRSQIKNTETEFGGNRKVVLIFCRRREDAAGSCLKNCAPLPGGV